MSVLLNLTPDHIDWHGSMEAYAADKARIFANQGPQDFAVVDVDDAGSAPYAEVAARPRRAGDARDPFATAQRVVPGSIDGEDSRWILRTGSVELVSADELRIRGEHNVSNALAAAAAAHAFGAHPDAIRAGLRTFAPIEHRLEPVGDVGGVEYFNDSKATNPDAVLKALTAFAERPLVVLLGGRNKGNDFSGLARAVAARAQERRCSSVRRAGTRTCVRGDAIPVVTCPGMGEAVGEAARAGEARRRGASVARVRVVRRVLRLRGARGHVSAFGRRTR